MTCYGLFVEHTQQYQTLWNGECGRVYFYQCEIPYDPPGNAAWGNNARGYAGYKVADHVKTHQALSLGVYCVFTKPPVLLHSAIEAPDTPGVVLRNMITCRFGGVAGSGIVQTLNDRGHDATKEFRHASQNEGTNAAERRAQTSPLSLSYELHLGIVESDSLGHHVAT